MLVEEFDVICILFSCELWL